MLFHPLLSRREKPPYDISSRPVESHDLSCVVDLPCVVHVIAPATIGDEHPGTSNVVYCSVNEHVAVTNVVLGVTTDDHTLLVDSQRSG